MYGSISVSVCVQPFRKLTQYQHTLYCDPDREVYKALGLYEKMAIGSLDSKYYTFLFFLLFFTSASVWSLIKETTPFHGFNSMVH